MMKAMTPLNYEISHDEVNPNEGKATLYLKGKMKNPFTGEEESVTGEITFLKENGEWKIQKEYWKE